ncbi:amyloid fiber anchoring/assembly protein TapA [Mesobacillus jeotgali]|uniref:amyloid fiber anchoring/assembly protein TapA n=1 Tax=Mesobacillus jeotgali TaxID=129985 RepID=UPI00131511D6|nr:amyloid fiber anchoring/assembly protein TapA [Mesobacillus jeotgali]
MIKKFTNFILNIIHKRSAGGEGSTIRYSRSRKFRKRYVFFRKSLQVLLAWYLLIFTVIQLNSFTNAAFNDVEELQASIHVKWPIDEWDKSSLDFDVAGLERGGSCQPPVVYAEIFNDGEDMTFSTWTWELFKVGKGQETKTPISPLLESGEVPMIKAGEKGRIVTTKLQELPGEGQYRFKVTKPDRPGQEAIWSEPIEIEGCIVEKVKTEQSVTEEKPTESNEKTDTSTSKTTEEIKDSPEEIKDSPDSESANEESEEENTESSDSNEEDSTNQEPSSEDQTEEQQPTDSTNGSDESNGN